MIKLQGHIIQTQAIEIEFRDRGQDMNLPNQISELVQLKLNEKLGKLLDEISPEERLTIESIDLDLGELKSENWEQEFIELALVKIKQAIIELKPAFKVNSSFNLNRNSNVSHSEDQDKPTGEMEAFEPNKLGFIQFAAELNYFLVNGFFTWRFSSFPIAGFEALFMASKHVNSQNFEPWANEIYTHLMVSNRALSRLFNQFSSGFITFLSAAIYKEVKVDEFNTVPQEITSPKLHFVLALWKAHQTNLIVVRAMDHARVKSNIKEMLTRLVLQSENWQESDWRLQKTIDRLMFRKAEVGLDDDSIDGKQVNKESILNEDIKNSNKKIIENTNHKHDPNQRLEYFISNSGLVLLHPYLTMFFKELGLINAQQLWLDEVSRSKGVLITQYLVQGEEHIEEQNLLLNKLICGMAFEETLENKLILTDKEKHLCNELLEAVISHWPALKSTSIDGLRNSFLYRRGKLVLDFDSNQLLVEQKAWDVLMAQLPWGVGVVKTPWMNKLLHVNW